MNNETNQDNIAAAEERELDPVLIHVQVNLLGLQSTEIIKFQTYKYKEERHYCRFFSLDDL